MAGLESVRSPYADDRERISRALGQSVEAIASEVIAGELELRWQPCVRRLRVTALDRSGHGLLDKDVRPSPLSQSMGFSREAEFYTHLAPRLPAPAPWPCTGTVPRERCVSCWRMLSAPPSSKRASRPACYSAQAAP